MSQSSGKVIILTGASRGIGLATAHHLLSSPSSHSVVLMSRTSAPLLALQTQYGSSRVEVLAGDMADFTLGPKAVELAIKKWGRLDAIVVNHGGLEPVKRVGDASVEEWRAAFDSGVFGGVGLIQASLPSLRTTRGTILLVSSGASTTPYVGWACYGAGKAVFNHLASSLGVEEPDITTLSIRPGVVDTQMQRDIREVHHEAMSEGDRTKFAGLKEGGKLLRPEQPGNVLARLAVAEGEQFRGLSGGFWSWDDEKLGAWQED